MCVVNGLAVIISAVTGCSKPAPAEPAEAALTGAVAVADGLPQTQLWHECPQKYAILFGYGYNEPDAVAELLEPLAERYGLAADGGMILPIVFPDDFRHGSRAVNGELYGMLQDEELIGIMTLGAPEDTARALIRIQDSFDGEQPFPIISFFSQDTVAATESVSDFVIDRAQNTDSEGMAELEADSKPESAMRDIVCNAVRLTYELHGAWQRDASVFECAGMLVSPRTLARYSDPETGLRSINHFVLP